LPLSILKGERSSLPMRTATNGKRFIVHADEKLTAFLELESAIRPASVELSSTGQEYSYVILRIPKNHTRAKNPFGLEF
jgi:hypothetical protein